MSYETTGTATYRPVTAVIHYRNSSVPNNLGIIANGLSISTSSTPTTTYANLSNNGAGGNDALPTSGDAITSVLVALHLSFEQSATIAQKFHLHSAEIEVY